MDGLLWVIFFACVAVGLTTCSVVEKDGQWTAYSNCLIHHTPLECKELRPK